MQNVKTGNAHKILMAIPLRNIAWRDLKVKTAISSKATEKNWEIKNRKTG